MQTELIEGAVFGVEVLLGTEVPFRRLNKCNVQNDEKGLRLQLAATIEAYKSSARGPAKTLTGTCTGCGVGAAALSVDFDTRHPGRRRRRQRRGRARHAPLPSRRGYRRARPFLIPTTQVYLTARDICLASGQELCAISAGADILTGAEVISYTYTAELPDTAATRALARRRDESLTPGGALTLPAAEVLLVLVPVPRMPRSSRQVYEWLCHVH